MAGRRRNFDRDEALSRALQVFWTRGYADTSMTDLTAAMGVNSPGLYAACGSKEALFREAVRLYADTAGAALWTSMREAPTAREAIEGLLPATAEANSLCDRPRGCLLVLSGAHADALPAGACSEVSKIREDARAATSCTARPGRPCWPGTA